MKAIIAADLAPLKLGSIELTFTAVGRLLEQAGYDVRFWFSGSISQSVRDYLGVPLVNIVADIGPMQERTGCRQWRQLLSEGHPEVLWLNFFPTNRPCVRQFRQACPKTRICVSDHISRGYPSRSVLRDMRRRAMAFWSRNSVDAYIAVSGFVAERMVKVDYIDAAKIHVVRNAVDLSSFSPGDQPGDCIACVSHMDNWKGVHVLLEALWILKGSGVSPPCKFVGTGPNLDAYRAFARQRSLDVEFLGMRDDVPDILRTAMITVVPSIWPEAFGYVAAEAQAVGVPVIASRVGGLPEVVEDGVTGLLVPPGNPEALADTLMELIGNPKRRSDMGAAGRRRAVERFDLSKAAAEIAGILSMNDLQRQGQPGCDVSVRVPTDTKAGPTCCH